jgi:hypothetical protein
MDCFGCAVMDPWRHQRDDVNLMFPPFAPSSALSMYGPMLREWLEYFDSSSLQVVNYETAIKDPLQVAQRLLNFIGALSLVLACLFLHAVCMHPRYSTFPCPSVRHHLECVQASRATLVHILTSCSLPGWDSRDIPQPSRLT